MGLSNECYFVFSISNVLFKLLCFLMYQMGPIRSWVDYFKCFKGKNVFSEWPGSTLDQLDPNMFLTRYSTRSFFQAPSMHLECLASYISELSLVEYNMLRHAPSLVAASAIFLARFILFPSQNPWVCPVTFKLIIIIFFKSCYTKVLINS